MADPGPRFGVLCGPARLARWQVDALERLSAELARGPAVWWAPSEDAARAAAGPWTSGRAATVRPAPDPEEVRGAGLDLVLHLGGPLPPAGVLEAPRAGVWTFRLGGDPPGFHEVHAGEPVARAALVRLVPGTPAPLGVELRGAVIRTVPGSWRRTGERLTALCAPWPAEAARELFTTGLRARTPRPLAPERAGAIGPGLRIAHALRALPRRAREAARRLLLVDRWNVGLVHAPIHAFLEPGFVPRIRWLPAPDDTRIAADPFALEHDGALHVLYEALAFREGRGYLVARRAALAGGEPGELEPERTVLRCPYHLSYPYLVREGGEIFCVPESCEAGEVALWRAVHFPERWEKVATLLPDLAGVDSTFVRRDDRWWCFTTAKGDSHDSKLQLFHAPALRGPWTPHARNPVKIDVRSARGGGTPFVHAGALYRPAQDYSIALEGRLTINRVRTLTPEDFEEETVVTVGPFPGEPFPDKFHTLCAAGEWTLVDGCRELDVLRHPSLLPFKLGRALARLRR